MPDFSQSVLSPEIEGLVGLDDERLAEAIGSMDEQSALRVMFDWSLWARPDQRPPPGDWFIWFLCSGRGSGKTRCGAEWIRAQVEESDPVPIRIALIGESAADVRDIIIEGESGLLSVCPPWNRPVYEPSKRRLTWANGSQATCYSGDKPDLLRGQQHDKAWIDEIAKFRRPRETWDQLEYGLRLGRNPRVVITSTPRPIPVIKALMADSDAVVTRCSTYANIAHLSDRYIARIIKRHEGTRLGLQEIHAQILGDMPGALWSHTLIENLRVVHRPALKRLVIAVDPQGSDQDQESGTVDQDLGLSETGIILAGLGENGHGYVLDDLSGYWSPHSWAERTLHCYNTWRANVVVAEINHGGAMVTSLLRTMSKKIAVKEVRASTGKYRRAEPIAALYEQGLVHHVGHFGELEDQMCGFNPTSEESKITHPDRMDALVWALHELMIEDDPDAEKWEHWNPERHTYMVPERMAA